MILIYDEPPQNFALKFNVRRYSAVVSVVVKAAALDAKLSTIAGPALLGAPADVISTATVHARDKFGNSVAEGLTSERCGASMAADFTLSDGRTVEAAAGCRLTNAAKVRRCILNRWNPC